MGLLLYFLAMFLVSLWFDGYFLHLVVVVFVAEHEKDPGTISESLMN